MAKLSSFVQKGRTKAANFTTPLSKALYNLIIIERITGMSRTKEYLFEVQTERADKWIRKRLVNKEADEDSEEYQDLACEYWNLQEYLEEQSEFEAELEWLKETGSSIHHQSFIDQLSVLRNLAKNDDLDAPYMIYKMSYAYTITLLESYLGDTAKSLISESEVYFRNGISKVDELKKARYSLEFLADSKIDARGLAIKELSNILYHKIPKVKRVLESILGTGLDIEIKPLVKIVDIRHDIIHRNGHTKEGVHIPLTKDIVLEMISEIEKFANVLQQQINKV